MLLKNLCGDETRLAAMVVESLIRLDTSRQGAKAPRPQRTKNICNYWYVLPCRHERVRACIPDSPTMMAPAVGERE